MLIGVFFGSTTGKTMDVAIRLSSELEKNGFTVERKDIVHCTVEDFLKYKVQVWLSPTWHDGQLQDDWASALPEIEKSNLENATVALIGLGDQYGFSEYFLNAIGELANIVKSKNAKLICKWSTEGYDFDSSNALDEEGNFFGLAIDEDNQGDLTDSRIHKWIEKFKAEVYAIH